MLTDATILSKFEWIEKRYQTLRFEKVADVVMEYCETKEYLRQEPEAEYRPCPAGTHWGGEWMTAWFRGDIELPQSCHGRKVFLRAHTGAPETMLIVDRQYRGVFDTNHPAVLMTMQGEAGHGYHVSLEAYAGHSFPGMSIHESTQPIADGARVFDGLEVVLEREDVSAFVFDVMVLRHLVQVLGEHSLRRGKIIAGLAEVFAVIVAMPEDAPEECWRPKLAQAREIMRPLLDAKNGPTTPLTGITGHSHLDTAWLWPIAETWRKAARTFSSMLNLMEQYPEAMFIQSAPYHTDVVRKEYPSIFERIQEMVAAGRWEPNGAMWVEPDCNIPSGESFIRQILIGQQTTRDMFGYTADVFWVPDVFGFSGALPQILRGCGIEFFCTHKLAWNDTTRFPYDTFYWKGIDGSSVLAHYHLLHCWPEPKELTEQWNWLQHKDAQDRRFYPYGYGDGGGGPMAEMLETARRVADLEGCPRTQYMTVSEFLHCLRDEMRNIPEWVGELYLQYHRGTLTSIAGIKRGNRKTEIALREAEFLSTLASLRGTPYPAEQFRDIWKEHLVNQFHDILPGSSIAKVNDEAVASYAKMQRELKAMTDATLAELAGKQEMNAYNILLINSLSWPRQAEISLDSIPAEMVPVDDQIVCQQITDIEGNCKLALHGITIPALGSIVLPLKQGSADGPSPFVVTADKIETPFATMQCDAAGRFVRL